VRAGSEVGAHYDSLLAKVVAHAPTRALALERLDGALAQLAILGPPVNTAFLRGLLADPRVRAGELDTGLVERLTADEAAHDGGAGAEDERSHDDDALAAAALARSHGLLRAAGDDPWERLLGWRADGPAPLRWRLRREDGGDAVEVLVTGRGVRVDGAQPRDAHVEAAGSGRLAITLDGVRCVWAYAQDGDVTRLGLDGRAWGFRDESPVSRDAHAGHGAALSAPMPGSVLLVHVVEGGRVAAGDVLVVLESMKMELQVVAPAAGTVERVAVTPGDRVAAGQVLVAIGAGTGGVDASPRA
jgi:acetyl-CoA/propionyl-CoA carboxylase biotin carboxyl carrier protein